MDKLILVVEDEVPILELLRDLLESEGFQVQTAHNGQEALVRLDEVPPDLVLADVMMPLLDGRGLCRHMRADISHAHIPLIFMSAATEPALKVEGCSYNAFIRKPFEIERLLELIHVHVGERS